jgi:hypothetical protein
MPKEYVTLDADWGFVSERIANAIEWGMDKGFKDQPNLRDRFAMVALVGIIAIRSDAKINEECHDAYMYADAMLKARES